MPFTAKDWQDSPSTTSPITAAALEDLEARVTDYAEAVNTTYTFKQFSNLAFDGTTDVGPAINAALVDISDAGGGVLLLPAGDGLISETIVLQNNTGIAGQGTASTSVTLANAVNADVIQNYVSSNGVEANAQFCSIRDLNIDGNRNNQSSGAGVFFTCLPLTTQAAGDTDFDPHHYMSNVRIYNCKEDGFVQSGRSAGVLENVQAYYCNGYGFIPSYDTALIACQAGQCGEAGFKLETSALILVGCKAFYSGQVTASNGHGFLLTGDVAASLSGCEAQDNKAHGFFFSATTRTNTLTACTADSNSTTSAGTYVGFGFDDSNDNRLNGCMAYERRANGATSYQTSAVVLLNGSEFNRIDVIHRAVGGATITGAVKSTSTSVANNFITIDNEGGYQTGTYAASYTPNPYLGTTIAMTLTGNITINAPAAANCHIGSKMRFILKQDGTGSRTGTWNAVYLRAGGALTLTTTANKTDVIDFEYDGTSWFETNRSLNL